MDFHECMRDIVLEKGVDAAIRVLNENNISERFALAFHFDSENYSLLTAKPKEDNPRRLTKYFEDEVQENHDFDTPIAERRRLPKEQHFKNGDRERMKKLAEYEDAEEQGRLFVFLTDET
jgi:hypothetical protein